MSQTPILSAHALFQSHLVNCGVCKKFDSVLITQIDEGIYNVSTKATNKHSLCPVGSILLQNALKEDPNTNPFKPKSFPFVAKLYERILVLVGNVWQEARVIDRSVSAAYQYEKLDEETGLLHWRTAAPQIVGYEVEIRGKRHYVNRHNIKKLSSSSTVERGAVNATVTGSNPVSTAISKVRIKHG